MGKSFAEEPARTPAWLHPPKVEYFDVAGMTNTDPKGFVRPVEQYQVAAWGLYMARTADHPQFSYLETCLLPERNIRITRFHDRPGHERDQDFYIDIGDYQEVAPQRWKAVDHYLDISLRTGRGADLLDVDELLAAHVAGHLSLDQAQRAFHTAAETLAGLAGHGYDLQRWLGSHAIAVPWQGPHHTVVR